MELSSSSLPTLYEYYTSGGITTGLSADGTNFTLNDRNITIYSGSLHYFRLPKAYWRDRLKKMRAAGLNAVETYVPWNLHEHRNGVYDWGDGDSDFESFLDIRHFLDLVKEEDLFALVRPGPYICSEWDLGGLPSWLLREKDIKVRTSDSKYMTYVTRYFNILLPILAAFQFTKGGPVIALQIENEYGSTQEGKKPTDKRYLEAIKTLMSNNGIVELLFTSDSQLIHGDAGAIPGVLQTSNFNSDPEANFRALKNLQPDKAVMAMEYWTGWFDHWSDNHNTVSADNFENILQRILKFPASVNMYMFFGGTNFGFMNGANIGDSSIDNKGYLPDTTSYDYDAPLNEAGDYTDKYVRTKQLISELNPIKTRIPTTPSLTERTAYPSINITHQLPFSSILSQVPEKVLNENLIPMEILPINNNSGQSHGYIVYRKTNVQIPSNATLQIKGRVCDSVQVLLNGVLVSKVLRQKSDLNGFGYWRLKDSTLSLGPESHEDATLELIVENWGRNNFGSLGQFNQFKGLWQGPVKINDVELRNWEIIPLEFKKKWSTSLTEWQSVEQNRPAGPRLYKAVLSVTNPMDTYIDTRNWVKGIVIVNGFVLGRHCPVLGPQLFLYLPAPLLNSGDNEILVFEQFVGAEEIRFMKNPVFGQV